VGAGTGVYLTRAGRRKSLDESRLFYPYLRRSFH
jgi:hypothetical protein